MQDVDAEYDEDQDAEIIQDVEDVLNEADGRQDYNSSFDNDIAVVAEDNDDSLVPIRMRRNGLVCSRRRRRCAAKLVSDTTAVMIRPSFISISNAGSSRHCNEVEYPNFVMALVIDR